MCVVAHTTLFEPGRLVRMDLRKIVSLMAIETAAFEDKPSTPIQFVALDTLHAGNGRMLVERLKGRGRIRTDIKMHFFFAALPQQNQRVQTRGRLQHGVKYIGKGLFGLDGGAVKQEFSRRRSGNQINLPACMR